MEYYGGFVPSWIQATATDQGVEASPLKLTTLRSKAPITCFTN